MDADHHQSLILVFLGPGADIGKRAQPVDAGVGPEIDEDDLSAQSRRRQGRRIEPLVRALERSQLGLAGTSGIEESVQERNPYSCGCRRLRHVHLPTKPRSGPRLRWRVRGDQELVRFIDAPCSCDRCRAWDRHVCARMGVCRFQSIRGAI